MTLPIWKIEGTDKRQEILDAKETITAQSTGGKDVDYFSPETGFVLLKKEKTYSTDNLAVQRVKALCSLSLNNPRLGLRESYYTVRQTPELIQPFRSTSNIYQAVLQSINDMEILADVDRDIFVEGKNPKGLIYYPFHMIYGNIKKPIGFTENIAKEVLEPEDITNCKNIVAIEKLSAAVPLADSKFPKLTNTLLVTTGGFYTRGIATIIQRFVEDKNVWLWSDGDVYGCYMREVIKLGSMNARHLDDKIRHPNVTNAGLFPSVGRELKLPNDIDEKRPMENPESKKRVELLRMVGLPEVDVKTFKDNYTYELEALNIAFRDRNNNPIGQALYLSKLMELTDRAIKPIPEWNAEFLQTQVLSDMGKDIKNKLLTTITFDTELKDVITAGVYEKINELIKDVPTKAVENVQEKLDLSEGEIKSQIYKWYVGHMEKESIPEDTITKQAYSITVKSASEKVIKEKVDKFKDQLKTMVKELLDELDLKVQISAYDVPSSNTTKTDMYQQVYKELKIKPADEQKMEKALKAYLQP